jgi:hypothetical protein
MDFDFLPYPNLVYIFGGISVATLFYVTIADNSTNPKPVVGGKQKKTVSRKNKA